eukprot:m.80448 g.80448  ORF g.80448 m.80448 type:complete len:56 (-) comp14209_c0_seq2:163-330(-)
MKEIHPTIILDASEVEFNRRPLRALLYSIHLFPVHLFTTREVDTLTPVWSCTFST